MHPRPDKKSGTDMARDLSQLLLLHLPADASNKDMHKLCSRKAYDTQGYCISSISEDSYCCIHQGGLRLSLI